MRDDAASPVVAGEATPAPKERRERRFPRTPVWKAIVLWVMAFLLMASAAVYQRMTGPTYPKRGSFEIAGETFSYRLVRSHETTAGARVAIPDPGGPATAVVYYKRYKTDDAFAPLPMERESTDDGAELAAYLPVKPAAGKLEYYVVIHPTAGERIVLGDGGKDEPTHTADEGESAGTSNIVIRYKDPVPDYVLIPHIFFMFFAMMFGMRAGLAALFAPAGMRPFGWVALIGITIGGMVLGPIVQKYAFGAYWTGFPFGGDLTDNKTLFMWVGWLIACTTLGLRPKRRESPLISRSVVILATIVMTAVYLVPHSMQGSELDYSKLEQGVAPADAIGTGD